jgi:hypothetical protein
MRFERTGEELEKTGETVKLEGTGVSPVSSFSSPFNWRNWSGENRTRPMNWRKTGGTGSNGESIDD